MATINKHCEVEVTYYRGEIRYREVRYPGDPTARWIGLERAAKLVGLTRLRELITEACAKVSPHFLDVRLRYYPGIQLATLEFPGPDDRISASEILTARGINGLVGQLELSASNALNFADLKTAKDALDILLDLTLDNLHSRV